MMGKIFHPPGAFRFPRDLHGHWTTLHATVPGTEGWSSSWSPSSVAAFHLLISQDLNWCSIDFLIDVMFKSAGCYPFIETILLNVLNFMNGSSFDLKWTSIAWRTLWCKNSVFFFFFWYILGVFNIFSFITIEWVLSSLGRCFQYFGNVDCGSLRPRPGRHGMYLEHRSRARKMTLGCFCAKLGWNK